MIHSPLTMAPPRGTSLLAPGPDLRPNALARQLHGNPVPVFSVEFLGKTVAKTGTLFHLWPQYDQKIIEVGSHSFYI